MGEFLNIFDVNLFADPENENGTPATATSLNPWNQFAHMGRRVSVRTSPAKAGE